VATAATAAMAAMAAVAEVAAAVAAGEEVAEGWGGGQTRCV
jgi:hypothetical protein